MHRLNLTLDDDTWTALERHAQAAGRPTATAARAFLKEAMEGHDAAERRRKLARDYAAGREDDDAPLGDVEAAQLDLLDDQGA